MAIEITPARKMKVSLWVVILGVFSVFLVAVFLGGYLYLEKLIRQMSQELQERNLSVVPLDENIKGKEGELFPVKQKIDDFGELLSSHKKPLKVFGFLEKICLPGIWFSSFDFNLEKGELTLSAQGDSFVTVEQQVLILKQEPLVKEVSLSGLSMREEGGVDFNLLLIFESRIFE